MTRHPTPPVAILLAGGLGTRFDAAGRRNKLLAPLPGDPDHRPVALASAHALLAALPRVIAVVRPDSSELENLLLQAGCEVVMSHATKRGMGASLSVGVQAGLEAAPAGLEHLEGWLVALADMPYLKTSTIRAVIDAMGSPDAIVAPRFEGQRGHPVGFGPEHTAALAALDDDIGARELIRDGHITFVDVDDSGILRDIDTPDDLR
ncbi:nucleotidyltransferase family protein [Pandoraea terrae]|nr:nucleotidyltransferase family protein [Pandoraea terrae]